MRLCAWKSKGVLAVQKERKKQQSTDCFERDAQRECTDRNMVAGNPVGLKCIFIVQRRENILKKKAIKIWKQRLIPAVNSCRSSEGEMCVKMGALY